jgi:hypothetical protein
MKILKKTFEIIIFPNPVQNILTLKTPEIIKEVSIIDLLGQEVNTNQLSTNSLDVSNLSEGIYIIKVTSENDKTFSTKFVKQ